MVQKTMLAFFQSKNGKQPEASDLEVAESPKRKRESKENDSKKTKTDEKPKRRRLVSNKVTKDDDVSLDDDVASADKKDPKPAVEKKVSSQDDKKMDVEKTSKAGEPAKRNRATGSNLAETNDKGGSSKNDDSKRKKLSSDKKMDIEETDEPAKRKRPSGKTTEANDEEGSSKNDDPKQKKVVSDKKVEGNNKTAVAKDAASEASSEAGDENDFEDDVEDFEEDGDDDDVSGNEGEEDDDDKKKKAAKPKTLTQSKLTGGKVEDTVKTGAAYARAIRRGKYDPVADAGWKKGEPVPYLALARTFDEIERTPGRLHTTQLICRLFRSVIALTPEDLVPCVFLSLNTLAPAHEGIELGVGEGLLIGLLSATTGRSRDLIRKEYHDVGDLGHIAQGARNKQTTLFKPKALTVRHVFKQFQLIASSSGKEVQKKREDMIKLLLVASQECEAKFIIRALQGKLRIGLADKTVIPALAHALTATPPAKDPNSLPENLNVVSSSKTDDDAWNLLQESEKVLKAIFCEMPDLRFILKKVLDEHIPVQELGEHCMITPGIPLKPMLAKPSKGGVPEVLEQFSDCSFTCEYKYDGERAQIHKLPDGTFKIYSRNLEDHTGKYPDIISMLSSGEVVKEDCSSFILDSEVVAYDRESKKILPFQVLSTRARKGVEESSVSVAVCVYAFDILYVNKDPLIRKPLIERRKRLWESFNEKEGSFLFAKYENCNEAEPLEAFFYQSLNDNCEGLMVKMLEGPQSSYEPSNRSQNWMKLKKDYLQGVGDSLDLVPIGAYFGRGKRKGVYGAYLLACYDDENEEYQSICKVGTGFSDEQLQKFSEQLQPHVVEVKPSYYQVQDSENLQPNVWFEPAVVWEVRVADLSISPVHKAAAGLVDPVKGIALRFPRLTRVRDDKKPDEATNATQVSELYQAQFEKKQKA